MDITASAHLNFDDVVTWGHLIWYDKDGSRYGINVHVNQEGVWQHTESQRNMFGRKGFWIRKSRPSRESDKHDRRSNSTIYLDATAKAHAKTVAYVIEQQNAHGLLQADGRDQIHRKELKTAADLKANAEKVRAKIRVLADAVRAGDYDIGDRLKGATESDLCGLAGLPDGTLVSLMWRLGQA